MANSTREQLQDDLALKSSSSSESFSDICGDESPPHMEAKDTGPESTDNDVEVNLDKWGLRPTKHGDCRKMPATRRKCLVASSSKGRSKKLSAEENKAFQKEGLKYTAAAADATVSGGLRDLNQVDPPEFYRQNRFRRNHAVFVSKPGKGDAVTRVMVTAFQVSETLGRSGSHASTVWTRCERLLREKSDAESLGLIPVRVRCREIGGRRGVLLGSLMHEIQEGKARKNSIGAGTSRVRSVLFKAVCDWLAVAPCSLQRQEPAKQVQVDGDHYVVDVIFEPGALYEEGSGKAGEYLRRLESEGEDPNGPRPPRGRRPGAAAIPSLQPNLGGLMLRPSWHVEPWEIDFDRRDRAGRGGFGEVFQGTWAGQPVAVKEVRDASPTDADVCDFVLEISLLSRLSHPNIVRFWRGCVDLRGGHRTLLLVTEWMDRGVLSQLLHESQEPSLSVASAQVLATGIARGVAYLHHVKILHLDLKSPNVP
ncbi:unnamed protein product [Durusdinium trenchii]|uniref:Protein kinase domain-containing protein n=1 Tax=Durusdinium trenchii TaxID=1381693 RepID=A0ABP0R3A1_9DINO